MPDPNFSERGTGQGRFLKRVVIRGGPTVLAVFPRPPAIISNLQGCFLDLWLDVGPGAQAKEPPKRNLDFCMSSGKKCAATAGMLNCSATVARLARKVVSTRTRTTTPGGKKI